MSKQVKTFCDCCRREITTKSYSKLYDFTRVIYAGPFTDEYVSKYKELDICDDCAGDFDRAIQAVFSAHIVTQTTVENQEGEQENEP